MYNKLLDINKVKPNAFCLFLMSVNDCLYVAIIKIGIARIYLNMVGKLLNIK